VSVDVARRLFGMLVTIAALAAVALPSALARGPRAQRSCTNADVAATSANRSAVKAAVVCLINLQRTSRGLPALRVDARLDRSAQHWSSSMVAGDYFSHGSNFGARIRGFGFNWSAAGENIATGYTTAGSVVTGWMASLGHCQNILSPRFAFVGTGIEPKASGLLTLSGRPGPRTSACR
jgi:uncharacterized protein YkwD